MNFNGHTLTLIGGLISAIGVLISIYGAYISSNSGEEWQKGMDEKTTTILDMGTNPTKAEEKLMEIREENFLKELERNFSNIDIDQILENAENLKDAGKQLELAKLQNNLNEHTKFIKFLRPILVLFNENFKNIIDALDSKGMIREKKYQFSTEKDWWLKGGGSLIQARTTNEKFLSIDYQPLNSPGEFISNAQIRIPGLKTAYVDLESGLTINFIDETVFTLKPEDMNNVDKQNLLIGAINRAVNESMTYQLGK